MNQLILGDCLEVLPRLEVGSIDLCLTDPPYMGLKGGMELKNGGIAKELKDSVSLGDEWAASLEWVAVIEALKPKAIISFVSYHGLADLINRISGELKLVGAWHKRNAHPGNPQSPHYTMEFYVGKALQKGLSWGKVPDHMDVPQDMGGCIGRGERIRKADGSNAHPSQKPLSVMMPLVLKGAVTVIDPFMGTGTTGIACLRAGVNFIGIERDPVYFAIAQKRIEQAQQQTVLELV